MKAAKKDMVHLEAAVISKYEKKSNFLAYSWYALRFGNETIKTPRKRKTQDLNLPVLMKQYFEKAWKTKR